MAHKVELIETRRGCAMLEKTPRYDVVLNGQRVGQLTFNMRGYIGYLPLHTGQKVDIGERPISAFRKEVARINREARANG
jgi:hypothetical protein